MRHLSVHGRLWPSYLPLGVQRVDLHSETHKKGKISRLMVGTVVGQFFRSRSVFKGPKERKLASISCSANSSLPACILLCQTLKQIS